MTAYLQPGDKIHITVPGDFGSKERGQKQLDEIIKRYQDQGIEVFAATSVIHSEQVTVVSVIRSAKAPVVPTLKPEHLKAHWNPPWQDPE